MVEKLQEVDPFFREQTPLMIVLSGISGAGKDSVLRRMRDLGLPFHFVVTATDRASRTEEVHGRDYWFYSTQEFERMIDEGELLEHAVVYGQYKGVPKEQVRQALDSGLDVVMRLDIQGVRRVKSLVPQAISIFVTCESEEEMVARLRERHTESETTIQRRLETAREELAHIAEFDYVVVNRRGALDVAVEDVVAIIRAEHCRSVLRRIDL